MNVRAIQQQLAQFAAEREWEQFHSPKNLATALTVETAELLEIFQWMTEEDSRSLSPNDTATQRARLELADVQIYLLRLADQLDVDVEQAVAEKIALNAAKYPVEKSKGHATKYTDL